MHTLEINDIIIKSTLSVTLLAITIALKLNFKDHIDNIYEKAYNKLLTLRRPQRFLTSANAKTLAISIREIQFAYCLVISNFCS